MDEIFDWINSAPPEEKDQRIERFSQFFSQRMMDAKAERDAEQRELMRSALEVLKSNKPQRIDFGTIHCRRTMMGGYTCN